MLDILPAALDLDYEGRPQLEQLLDSNLENIIAGKGLAPDGLELGFGVGQFSLGLAPERSQQLAEHFVEEEQRVKLSFRLPVGEQQLLQHADHEAGEQKHFSSGPNALTVIAPCLID